VRPDVIIAGAGPAGAIAAFRLARAGARVQMFDRARFPRAKLCGDTLNPGALRVLSEQIPVDDIIRRSLPLDGMLLTGPGVAVRGTYGENQHGRALVRQQLDQLLLDHALSAGVQFDEGTGVVGTATNARGEVIGVVVRRPDGRRLEQHAVYVIAADGRESRLARSAGLSAHPLHPRRWAIGGYFRDAHITLTHGEMHVRHGHYIGIAPVPGGIANVCLVVPHTRGGPGWRDPQQLLRQALAADPHLRPRFAGAELIEPPQVLGPMAIDARAPGVPGMVLAGDAAGFIDPITGDGLRLALQGGILAGDVVEEVLAGRCDRAQAASILAARRELAFAAKWRFNRVIRRVVASPHAVSVAALAASLLPTVFRSVIRYAGDCE
jgi:flavin-dependent dehydrogenase